MNRPIKFRAWSKKRLSIEQVCGYWWEEEGCNSENLAEGFNYDDYALMQFTGLTDKNGKEIYEGDILASDCNEKPCHYIVKWADSRPEYCGFVLNPIMLNPPRMTFIVHNFKMWMAEGFSVIGNIFENPEILS